MGDYVFRIQNEVIAILRWERDVVSEERELAVMREWEYNKKNMDEALGLFEEIVECTGRLKKQPHDYSNHRKVQRRIIPFFFSPNEFLLNGVLPVTRTVIRPAEDFA